MDINQDFPPNWNVGSLLFYLMEKRELSLVAVE